MDALQGRVPVHSSDRVAALTLVVRLLLACLLTCLVATASTAASLSPATKSEIDALISNLETSGCKFNRNGTWYTSAEAKSHLLRKLKYLEERGSVQSAEQFIELAASSSSRTGQPYLVKCGNALPVESGTWLLSQLQAMRSAGPTGGPAPTRSGSIVGEVLAV